MAEVLLEAFLDTLKVLPFLLLVYIIIELIEHKTSVFGNRKILQGKLSPLIGSAAGLIPLCGFSVMAAKLYDRNHIRTGTVMAVFIATSDEALILLISNVTNVRALTAIVPLILVKFVLALIVGYAATAILFREKTAEISPDDKSSQYSCGDGNAEENNLQTYFLGPLWHSLKITLYLLIVNVIFAILIYYVGEDNIQNALATNIYLQPLITAAVGLIPSCASSVIVTTAYVGEMIEFGSLVAGLVVNAGMGFVILLKNPKKIKRNLALIATMFAISYLSGMLINLVSPLFGI